MARLVLKAGTAEEQLFEIEGAETTIGRSPSCTISIVDQALSRRHAVLRVAAGEVRFEDTGSANGSFVNGERVKERVLADGDTIRLGSLVFTFVDPPEQKATLLLDAAELARLAAEEQASPPLTRPIDTSPPAPPTPAPTATPPSPAPPAPVAPPPSPTREAPASPPPIAPPPAVMSPPPAPPTPIAPPRPAPAAVPAPAPATPAPPPAHPQPTPPPASEGSPPAAPPPAGFWIRFAAYALDQLLLGLILCVVAVPAVLVAGLLAERAPAVAAFVSVLAGLLATALGVLYLLFFWATRGATPGKRLLKLEIVRSDGVRPLGWNRAGLRLLGYVVSGLILNLGFVMAAFTARKQGLHDLIASTLVVKTGNR